MKIILHWKLRGNSEKDSNDLIIDFYCISNIFWMWAQVLTDDTHYAIDALKELNNFFNRAYSIIKLEFQFHFTFLNAGILTLRKAPNSKKFKRINIGHDEAIDAERIWV